MSIKVTSILIALGVLVGGAIGAPAGAQASSTRAPALTYAQAKKAATAYAVKFAAKDAVAPIKLKTQPVVGTLMRMSRLSYYTQTSWTKTNPVGCHQCGYDPATDTLYDTPTDISCSISAKVVRSPKRSYRISVVIQDSSCI
jgi:hypothetical protein